MLSRMFICNRRGCNCCSKLLEGRTAGMLHGPMLERQQAAAALRLDPRLQAIV